MAVDAFPDSGVVPCDSWAPEADTWTVELNAGDTLSAAVDTSDDSDVGISLVDPSGCLVADVYPNADCTGGGDCASLEYNAAETGTYSLFVYSDWCNGDTVAYELGASVQ